MSLDSLDAMLDQVADNFNSTPSTTATSPRGEVAPKPAATPTPEEIKPWLAARLVSYFKL